MWSQWLELKMTLMYMMMSVMMSILMIWGQKEWYWHWVMEKMGLSELPMMVTSMMEELMTYVSLSWWLGMFIGQLSVILLVSQYIKKGLYVYEYKVLNSLSLTLLLVNLMMPPMMGGGLEYWLTLASDKDMVLMGKMSQYLEYMQMVMVLSQLVWVMPMLLGMEAISGTYTKNSKMSMYVLTLLMGMMTPPDIWIVLMAVSVMFTVMEAKMYLKEWTKE